MRDAQILTMKAPPRKSAEGLNRAIQYGARLPNTDASHTIAVGVSTGGLATVALTANAPPNLVAAINFAGGRGSRADYNVCNSADLIHAYSDFGKRSRVPMLWIYAEMMLISGRNWRTSSMLRFVRAEESINSSKSRRPRRPATRYSGAWRNGRPLSTIS